MARHSVLIGNHSNDGRDLPYFDSFRTSILRASASTVISK